MYHCHHCPFYLFLLIISSLCTGHLCLLTPAFIFSFCHFNWMLCACLKVRVKCVSAGKYAASDNFFRIYITLQPLFLLHCPIIKYKDEMEFRESERGRSIIAKWSLSPAMRFRLLKNWESICNWDGADWLMSLLGSAPFVCLAFIAVDSVSLFARLSQCLSCPLVGFFFAKRPN